jgi:hypothetical protein
MAIVAAAARAVRNAGVRYIQTSKR